MSRSRPESKINLYSNRITSRIQLLSNDLYQQLEKYENSSPRLIGPSRKAISEQSSSSSFGKIFSNPGLTRTKVLNVSQPLRECLEAYVKISPFDDNGLTEKFIYATVDISVIVGLMKILINFAEDKHDKNPAKLDKILNEIQKKLFGIKGAIRFMSKNNILTDYSNKIAKELVRFYVLNIKQSIDEAIHEVKTIVEFTQEQMEELLGNKVDFEAARYQKFDNKENKTKEEIQKKVKEFIKKVKEFIEHCQPKKASGLLSRLGF